jgi:hypothetical protein
MKVGIIQSNYIPWRGYFDFIDSVDLFVFHDDLQYTKGDWRNRNKIKTANGLKWLTVPVHYCQTTQLICETAIDYSTKWQINHKNQIKASYRETPFLSDVLFLLEEAYSYNDKTISQLNIRLIRMICAYLKIETPFVMSAEYGLTGAKTERLIQLLNQLGASTYVSGPSANNYLDENLFRESGIDLEYKKYEYQPYPQNGGDFEGRVSVIDLLANCGPGSTNYLKSLTPNNVVGEAHYGSPK